MKRLRISAFALVLSLALALVPAPAAEACFRCQLFFSCSVDECFLYEICVFPQNLQTSRSDCWSDFFSCYTSGQHCPWT